MKKADLEKTLGKKIRGQMQQTAIPSRFGDAANAMPDRREQRKLDQAAGLVPFAVKLHEDLVRRLHEVAAQEGIGLNDLTSRLIQAGLPAEQPASAKKAATKPPAEEAVAEKAVDQKATAKQAPATKAAAKKAAKPA